MTYTITDLTGKFDLPASTIRYYEIRIFFTYEKVPVWI